ncbi:MAG: hypothetical protein LBM87_02485 [Ruminococcus sp.]|jgi:hypothetical protein|nr:hypothetical protein [Ruminococcus sp.]
METFSLILGLIVAPIVVVFSIINTVKKSRETSDAQYYQKKELTEYLTSKGFNITKMISVTLPGSGYYLRKNMYPAMDCIMCVDKEKRKWTIALDGQSHPRIYKFSEFREFIVEINGRGAGDVGYNAVVGYIFGGLIGAAAGAALTRRYGTIKELTLKIRINDLNNQFIYIPIVTVPQGIRDDDKYLPLLTTFASEVEQAFAYIGEN